MTQRHIYTGYTGFLIYLCVTCSLSAVQMKTVNIDKHVGENVTIRCSGWDVLMYVEENVKYFCSSPCTEDKHVIIKAGYEKINRKDRIKLFNNGEVLSVTFTDLQKSDAGKYYCGVEIVGIDAYIEVNVNVKDVLSFCDLIPKSCFYGSVSEVMHHSEPCGTMTKLGKFGLDTCNLLTV
uniref:Immunoglobulin domain-containing protein n=1 Tax=Labrus bergylta TaxID=56723 RepID=A0A3Q3FAG4_9LABR